MGLPSQGKAAPRIALIEDDESLALMLRYNLDAIGYAVEWTAHGTAALTRLLDDPPDLVVLDWVLPGLSGIEILRQIRLNTHTRALPVVMLTARTDREDRLRALQLGVDAFVAKPFAVGDVISRLQRLLSSD
jgi:two-component system, OmpR family, phosphate regulon response regulator PhoB